MDFTSNEWTLGGIRNKMVGISNSFIWWLDSSSLIYYIIFLKNIIVYFRDNVIWHFWKYCHFKIEWGDMFK